MPRLLIEQPQVTSRHLCHARTLSHRPLWPLWPTPCRFAGWGGPQASKAIMRTPAMTLAFVNVLRRLGVAYIVAEEEADSQIGRLYQEQLACADISEPPTLDVGRAARPCTKGAPRVRAHVPWDGVEEALARGRCIVRGGLSVTRLARWASTALTWCSWMVSLTRA